MLRASGAAVPHRELDPPELAQVVEVAASGHAAHAGYRHDPDWYRQSCTEDNQYVGIAGEIYFLSGDGGLLMPAKKDQPAPDLRYFKKTGK